MHSQSLLSAFFASILASLPFCCAQAASNVRVDAGDFPRENTLVSFTAPTKAPFFLKRDTGETVAVQIDESGRGWFLLPTLARGQSASFQVVDASGKKENVQVQKNGRKYELRSASHALMEYQAEPGELPRDNIKPLFVRGGYLHPIRTLSGKVVTDDFPPNHIHHHGVWAAWTKTDFEGRHPDFWNMGDGKGKVEFEKVEKTFSGPVYAGFVARHRYVDLTAAQPKTVLNETWDVRAYPPDSRKRFWIFDLTATQLCAASEPLKLPEYRYGGIGFRGNWAWNGKDKTQFLTSEGETDRLKGQGTRGRWCDISGLVDGARAGIAIMCHPENFRAPQPMRLHPDEPFFNYAPQAAGPMEITPGKPYVMRYRFVVHDGAPDKDLLERLWQDYAQPPAVTVE